MFTDEYLTFKILSASRAAGKRTIVAAAGTCKKRPSNIFKPLDLLEDDSEDSTYQPNDNTDNCSDDDLSADSEAL